MKKLLVILFLAFAARVVAQQGTILGVEGTGEYGFNVCSDNNGNFYTGGGHYMPGVTNRSILIVKQNVNHTVIWSKIIRFPDGVSYRPQINFLDVIGDTVFGCGTFNPDFKGSFYFKMNAQTGNCYWVKSQKTIFASLTSMRYSNGRYLLTGFLHDTTAIGALCGKVMSVSSQSGNIIWETPALHFEFPTVAPVNSTRLVSSTQVVNGKMFITGMVEAFGSNLGYGNIGYPILVGITENGTIFLQKYYDTFIPPTPDFAFLYGKQVDYDGTDSLIIAVENRDFNDFRLIKTDLSGNVGFAKKYYGVGTRFHSMNSSQQDYVILADDWDYHLTLMKIARNGQPLTANSLGHPNPDSYLWSDLNTYKNRTGNNAFYNGQYYFAVPSGNNEGTPDSDIWTIIADQNLIDTSDCLVSSGLNLLVEDLTCNTTTVTRTDYPSYPVYGNNYTIQNPGQLDPCAGASLNLSQNTGCSLDFTAAASGMTDPFIIWSNGDTGPTTSINVLTPLIVNVTDQNCCHLTDTIIPVLPSTFLTMSLPADTSICVTPGIVNYTIISTVNANPPGVSYLWSNGSTNQNLTVNTTGTYWLDVTSSCGTLRDSITVNFLISPVIQGEDTVNVCSSNFPYQYVPYIITSASVLSWDNGVSTPQRTFYGPGSYMLTATNVCGQFSFPVTVTQTLPPDIQLTDDIDTCLASGQPIALNPVITNSNDILWSTGATQPGITIHQSGTYSVSATNICGTVSEAVDVLYNSPPVIYGDPLVEVCNQSFPVFYSPDSIVNANNISWENGSSSAQRTINGPGNYTLTATNFCGQTSFTVSISATAPPQVQLIASVDTCLHVGQTLPLVPVYTNTDQTMWSTGEMTAGISVNASGIYTVTASNECGSDSENASITLNFYPELNLPAHLDTCFEIGTGFFYTAQGSPGNYSWSSGSQTASEHITDVGIYIVSLTNGCGTTSRSMTVNRYSEIDISIPYDSLTVCESAISANDLQIETNYDLEILYNGEAITDLNASGWYIVHAFNPCNEAFDSIYVNLEKEQYFYLPNAFTPNDDEFNPLYTFSGENIIIRQVVIYNRWGEEVYAEIDHFTGWDGTYEGNSCPDGVYSVNIVYENCDQIPVIFSGHVTLLR